MATQGARIADGLCWRCGEEAAGPYCVTCGAWAAEAPATLERRDDAATAEELPLTPEPLATARYYRRGTGALLVVAGLVCVGLAVAAAAVSIPGGGRRPPSFGQNVAAAFAPVIADNQAVSAALGGLQGGDAIAAQAAVSRTQTAVAAARSELDAVPAGFRRLADEALGREDAYLAALNSALTDPTGPGASELQPLARELTAALDAVGDPLAGASQSVTGADAVASWVEGVIRQRQAQAARAVQPSKPPKVSRPRSRTSRAPAPSRTRRTPAPSISIAGGTDCGGGLLAGPTTSCEFAGNVRAAFAAARAATARVSAFSPVTGRSYVMACSARGSSVTCAGGNSASVAWAR